MKYEIKTATATYTGGGLYIFYGQLKNGLYFSAYDEWESIYICNEDTSTEAAQYLEFYERHAVEELTGKDFQTFWNEMLSFILSGGPSPNKRRNYSISELKERILK